MPSLTLPPRSPGTLRAFWLCMSCIGGLFVGGSLAAVRRDARLLYAAAPIAALIAAPGLWSPRIVSLPYRAWNRLARICGQLSTGWVTRVAFEVTLATRGVGETAAMPTGSDGSSGWSPRTSQPPAAYRYQDASPSDDDGGDAIARFAQQREHAWARSLLPLVRLLQAIQTEDDTDELPPPDIYTLY